MMKLKCKLNYKDKKTGMIRQRGEEFVEDNKRAKEIISKGYADLIEQTIEEAILDIEEETAQKRYAKK